MALHLFGGPSAWTEREQTAVQQESIGGQILVGHSTRIEHPTLQVVTALWRPISVNMRLLLILSHAFSIAAGWKFGW